ncbi:MAG: hypothetical protein MI919_05465 [Holophagales bacterium]|nr:hypothetical protein [Holophagales bacterium]
MLPLPDSRRSAPTIRLPLAFVLVLASSLLLLGCPPTDPQERVSFVRGQYALEVGPYFVKEEPEEVEAAGEGAAGEEAAGEEAASDEAEDDGEAAAGEVGAGEGGSEGESTGEEVGEDAAEGEVAAAVPAVSTIVFNLVLYFNGDEPLPGVTLDFSHDDASGNEKKTWRHYVETADMLKGQAKQLSVEQDVEGFGEGDQLSVVLVEHVSAEDRAEYREYAEAGQ